MNPPSNFVPEVVVGSQGMASSALPPTQPLYWSVQRELWENRSIYIAPLAVAAFVLFASLISVIGLASQRAVAVKPFKMAPAAIMMTTLLVGVFYLLDALYGERRDRSILFWKSLPVSDFTTVIAKASIPLVILPLIAFLLSVATQLALLMLSSPVLIARGVAPATWGELQFFEGVMVMLYGLTVHALWFAPIYGWLLLVSAWARRAPVLWVALPLFAISAFEWLAFKTSLFASLLKYRVTGAMSQAFALQTGSDGHVDIGQITPAKFLATPGLWIGLFFTAACIAAAVRLRRNREPI